MDAGREVLTDEGLEDLAAGHGAPRAPDGQIQDVGDADAFSASLMFMSGSQTALFVERTTDDDTDWIAVTRRLQTFVSSIGGVLARADSIESRG